MVFPLPPPPHEPDHGEDVGDGGRVPGEDEGPWRLVVGEPVSIPLDQRGVAATVEHVCSSGVSVQVVTMTVMEVTPVKYGEL